MDGIVDDFILGFYDYVAPRDPNRLPDPLKQLVRGFRPRLELPSLRLKDPRRMQSEMIEQKRLLETEPISSKALEQFPKMVRNALDCGAHNRFSRAAPVR